MTKLVTDSKALMDLFFTGTAADDTPIADTIARLKEAAFACTQLRVTAEYEEPDTIRRQLDTVNATIVETWKQLLALQNDFKDLAEAHFNK